MGLFYAIFDIFVKIFNFDFFTTFLKRVLIYFIHILTYILINSQLYFYYVIVSILNCIWRFIFKLDNYNFNKKYIIKYVY